MLKLEKMFDFLKQLCKVHFLFNLMGSVTGHSLSLQCSVLIERVWIHSLIFVVSILSSSSVVTSSTDAWQCLCPRPPRHDLFSFPSSGQPIPSRLWWRHSGGWWKRYLQYQQYHLYLLLEWRAKYIIPHDIYSLHRDKDLYSPVMNTVLPRVAPLNFCIGLGREAAMVQFPLMVRRISVVLRRLRGPALPPATSSTWAVYLNIVKFLE